MELLRIVSMLLVLVAHASFKSLDPPSSILIEIEPFSAFMRFLCESLSIVCVNVFILISGWFEIQPKLSKLLGLIFQVLFIGIICYFILRVLGMTTKWNYIEWGKLLTFRRGLWFVNSYIVLYVFSPVLNMYSEKASKKEYQVLLFSFFTVQTLLGFISSESYFSGGYSPLSFIGLYLLARYIRLYPNKYTTLEKKCDLVCYMVTALATTFLSILLVMQTGKDGWMLYSYSSPLVILSSISFFLFFTKLSFQNNIVNWIASSSFAVYIFHQDPLIIQDYYCNIIKKWHDSEELLIFISYTASYIILIFIISLALDKIRYFVWYVLCKYIIRTNT